MMRLKPSWQAMAAAAAVLLALTGLPLTTAATAQATLLAFALTLAALAASLAMPAKGLALWVHAIACHAAALELLGMVTGAEGSASRGFFALLAANWLLAWRLVSVLSGSDAPRAGAGYAARLVVPALFGLWVLVIWEAVTRGAGIPFVLLPPPSAIGARIMTSLPILWADFNQTVLKSVLAGFVMGSASGFIVAVLADRYKFLSNAFLPIGNLVSALPIIGIAPIMVIWFGFDWQSKAAVVVVMTFFPMLVNTLAGLQASGHSERDLMRTYASGHWQTLFKLRLPAAMPFIFNALKINSTLALIGAIVSEFFGTPVVGMGFRISTETGRMALDMVWAEIAVAALAGSLFYGALATLERMVTFWHPSYRRG